MSVSINGEVLNLDDFDCLIIIRVLCTLRFNFSVFGDLGFQGSGMSVYITRTLELEEEDTNLRDF